MPRVGTTYTVGVIREKEKGFLSDAEYTRIIEAPSAEEAVRVLFDTPYGVWLNGDHKQHVFDALVSHLQEELVWIIDLLENPAIKHYMTARYNALDLVNGIYERKIGQENLSDTSPLSSVTENALHATLWNNQSWDHLPSEWIEWTKQAQQDSHKKGWTMQSLLKSAEEKMWEVMEENANNDLAKELLSMQKDRLSLDKSLRESTEDNTDKVDDKGMFSKYSEINQKNADQVKEQNSATDYEKDWDNQLLSLIKKYRLSPTGYEPVMAYWYGKEMEARHLRILLSAKMGGVEPEVLQNLQRISYTSLV